MLFRSAEDSYQNEFVKKLKDDFITVNEDVYQELEEIKDMLEERDEQSYLFDVVTEILNNKYEDSFNEIYTLEEFQKLYQESLRDSLCLLIKGDILGIELISKILNATYLVSYVNANINNFTYEITEKLNKNIDNALQKMTP